ncbi:hypothetical protein LCGC14_2762460, partial [marine sediment metagenome]
HGGALMRGGTPESLSKGGKVAAERRRAIREGREEAIRDALTGHLERLAGKVGQLMDDAEGKQYRCPNCGAFGPKKPMSTALKEVAGLVQIVMATVKAPMEVGGAGPTIQVIVAAGAPVIPLPLEPEGE